MSDARVEAAVKAACRACGVHLACTYPECKCQNLREQIPAALAAADAVSLANGAEVDLMQLTSCCLLGSQAAAALAGLAGQNAKLKAALQMAFDVLCAIGFEPDPGKPHPMPDGAIDRAIDRARAALQEPPDAT